MTKLKHLECKVLESVVLKSHELIIGEIVETYVNSDCMTGGKPDVAKIDPLAYSIGAEQYQHLGEMVGQAFHMGKEGNWFQSLLSVSGRQKT